MLDGIKLFPHMTTWQATDDAVASTVHKTLSLTFSGFLTVQTDWGNQLNTVPSFGMLPNSPCVARLLSHGSTTRHQSLQKLLGPGVLPV